MTDTTNETIKIIVAYRPQLKSEISNLKYWKEIPIPTNRTIEDFLNEIQLCKEIADCTLHENGPIETPKTRRKKGQFEDGKSYLLVPKSYDIKDEYELYKKIKNMAPQYYPEKSFLDSAKK